MKLSHLIHYSLQKRYVKQDKLTAAQTTKAFSHL